MSTAQIRRALVEAEGNVQRAAEIVASGLVESKSLTKSAVALAYAHANVDERLVLVDISGTKVTVGAALRHMGGFSNENWDYDAFIAAVDAYSLSISTLSATRRVKGFEYNDAMYQVLATRFEQLAKRKIDDVFKEIVGDAPFFWKRDARGSPLGPNGLFLSREAARRMGEAARQLTRGSPRAAVPDNHWVLAHHPDIKTYVGGWWETSNGDLLAIGYRHYYIVVTAAGVFVQLFDDDYKSDLTAEQKNFAVAVTRNDARQRCLERHGVMPEGVGVTVGVVDPDAADLATLRPGQWLSDAVLTAYFALVEAHHTQAHGGKKRIHIFSPHFMTVFLEKGFKRVKSWTKKFDLFALDKVLVPVHVNGNHWIMMVADMRAKTITTYDSLGRGNVSAAEALYDYLQQKAADDGKNAPDGWEFIPLLKDAPQQNNRFDCGVFAARFAFLAANDRPFDFGQSNIPELRKRMIDELQQKMLLE